MSKTHTIASKSTTSVKKTSKKRAKDPNAPKRFRTAYILFCVEKRNEVKVNITFDLFASFLLNGF
jgi:hypothetical protein